ncbi:hypothetical protein PWP89_06940 [Stenotrophomonas rhizophila]|uniref:hypothetical protein n=1 Tax=Stenotrophomonas rhizophila TaxID=216778 RepID=UPI0011806A8C|nr:hypothetical protein [Stenotrophomonas rhizophila]
MIPKLDSSTPNSAPMRSQASQASEKAPITHVNNVAAAMAFAAAPLYRTITSESDMPWFTLAQKYPNVLEYAAALKMTEEAPPAKS